MADVKLSTQGVDVNNEGTAPVFEVRDKDKLVGRLTVSKGGVRWLPANLQEPHFANWAAFDTLMKSQKRDG